MRFMSIISSAQVGMPTPELMEAAGKLADREIKAGRIIDAAGLMPIATGARAGIKDGKLLVVDGPFVEAKEVVGGATSGWSELSDVKYPHPRRCGYGGTNYSAV